MTLVIDVNETTVADFDGSVLEGFNRSVQFTEDFNPSDDIEQNAYGSPGNDFIDVPYAENSAIYGDRGSDVIRVEAGENNEIYLGSDGGVALNGADGTLIEGTSEADLIVSTGLDAEINASEGDNVVFLGPDGSGSMTSGSGNDTVIVSGADYSVETGDGNDTIYLDISNGIEEALSLLDFNAEKDQLVIVGAPEGAEIIFDEKSGLLTIGGVEAVQIGNGQMFPTQGADPSGWLAFADTPPNTFGFDVCF